MPKISLNLDESILEFEGRFGPETTRTETIAVDLLLFSKLMKSGVRSVYEKLKYQEFVVFTGSFLSTMVSGFMTPSVVRAHILEYLEYDHFPPEDMDINRLVQKIQEMNDWEICSLFEMIRKWKNSPKNSISMDEQLATVGITPEKFINAKTI